MSKLGGWSRNVKGRPHQRIICIPLKDKNQPEYVVERGCRVLSHTTFMNRGVLIAQLIVDVKDQIVDSGSQMPHGWDYRNLLRDGVTPVRRRVARRKAQREPGGKG